ncbi:MAG: amidase [Gemmatimonadaceae bacterium]|nr:amidase [Gemmatimonadaceae bacterium]
MDEERDEKQSNGSFERREFLGYFAGSALASTLFPGVLWAKAAAGAEIDDSAIIAAAQIAGVTIAEDDRRQMLEGLKGQTQRLTALRLIPLANAVPPALLFNPLPKGTAPTEAQRPIRPSVTTAGTRPADLESLAFATVTELGALLRARKVTSVELTQMYIARLKRLDPKLKCTITITEERALAQARAADAELAAGKVRGPLHGIPWGAKDLLAVTGYPTTWGSAPYKNQLFEENATVVDRLDRAGAVLIAKLTLGELAQGDIWFGGMTRNPWKLDQGSSGSSAGPGSATAAGCVGFAIGTETLGSISSPSTRNGVTGLRPTYGRVPRTGAMALSWSMDKIGPMCRSVEDCALVFDAIRGRDGHDLTVHDAAFNWDAARPLSSIRIGYLKSVFDLPEGRGYTTKSFDSAALAVFARLGVKLTSVELPILNYDAMRIILTAEAGAAFDELTRSGRVREMAQQGNGAWPNTFRTSRFIPAVDYINANRVRSLAIQAWARLFETIDVIVAPTSPGSQLVATNLTGHPAVILPHGFRDDGTPVSLTFLGALYGEAPLLRVAKAYQDATEFHRKHPTL